MEKNKQDTNDIGNTNHKNENPFKATNPPGKKKKRWRSTRIWAVETDPGENLKHLMSETKLGNPCQGIMPSSEENRSKQ